MPRIDPLVAEVQLKGLEKIKGDLERLKSTLARLNAGLSRALSGANAGQITNRFREAGNAAERAAGQVKKFTDTTGLVKMDRALKRLHDQQIKVQTQGLAEAQRITDQLNQRRLAGETALTQAIIRLRKQQAQQEANLQKDGVRRAEQAITQQVKATENGVKQIQKVQASLFKQNQKLQQQGLKEAQSFIAKQNRTFEQGQRKLNEALFRLNRLRGVQQLPTTFDRMRTAIQGSLGPLQRMASFFGRIALFTVAASVITRGFFAIGTALGSIVGTAIEFNSRLEQGRLAIAGILASTRKVVASTGDVLKPAESYRLLLSRAASLQREVLLASIETLGTSEELEDVFLRILGLSADQKATDEDRLELAQNILNAGKLLGLNGEQLAVEARQLLTLETQRGQLIAQALGISIEQLRTFKKQGILVEELNKELGAFSAIAEDVAGSFLGLTSSLETLFKFTTGAAFEDIFRGVKDIIRGITDELKRIDAEGGLTVLLGLTKRQLEDFGRTIAQFVVAGVQKLAQALAVMARFIQSNSLALKLLIAPLRIVAAGFQILAEVFKTIVTVGNFVSNIFSKISNFLGSLGIDVSNLSKELKDLFNIIEKGVAGAGVGALIGLALAFIPGVGPAAAAAFFATIGVGVAVVQNFKEEVKDASPEVQKFTTLLSIVREEIDKLGKLKLGPDTPFSEIERRANAIRDTLAELSTSVGAQVPFDQQAGLVKEIGQLDNRLNAVLGTFITMENREKELAAETEKLRKQFAAFRAEVEELERSLQQSFALDIGDLDTFERVGLARIEEERLDNLEKFKGIKDKEVDIERKAALQRIELAAEVAERRIELEQEAADEAIESIQRQVDAQQAVAEAADAARQASLAHLESQLQIAQEQGAGLMEQVELQKQINALQIEGAQAQLEAINKNIESTKRQIELTEAQIAATEKTIEVLKEQVKVQEGLEKLFTESQIRTATDSLKEQRSEVEKLNNELTRLGGSQQAAQTNIRTTQTQASQAMRSLTTEAIQLGDVIRDSIGQVFDALIAGTLDLEDAFKSFGLAIGKRFADALASMITDKLGFDLVFQKNLGSLSAGFGSFASGLSTSFGSLMQSIGIDFNSLTHNLGVALEAALQLDFQAIFGSGGALLSAFDNLGVLGGGALGFGLARGIGSAFGLGGTSGIGALVGGALGSLLIPIPGLGTFVGSFFGDISEAIFGGLFSHKPTKGTQVRKGVIDFLEELDVIFADELESGDYGFRGTSRIADEFGISFLEASFQNIPTYFPRLDAAGLQNDLVALGLFLTEPLAEEVGKDLEQTAITFANLIADNLGDNVEEVQAFIDDAIEKAEISLGGLVLAISDAFEEARISAETFGIAMEGALDIFSDIAPNIDVDAFREAATFLPEHGGFNSERFVDLFEGAIGAVELLGRSASDAILQGIEDGLKDGVDFEARFRADVINSLRTVVAEGFVQGLIAGITVSPALAFAFSEFQRIIEEFVAGTITAEMFTQQMNAALEASRPELELWAEAVGEGGAILAEFLNDAIPQVQDINDSVTGTANEVARTARELQNIADSLRQAVSDLQTGPLSPLPKKRRLEIALAEFTDLRDRALAGDTEAARQLITQGNEVLQLAQDIFKSGQQFQDIFNFVQGTLLDVADAFDQGIDLTLPDGTQGTGTGTGAGGAGSITARQPNIILEDMLIELRAIRSVLEFSTGIFVGGTAGPGGVPGGTGTGTQTPFSDALNATTRDLDRFQNVLDQSNDILTTQFQSTPMGLNQFGHQAERANIRAAVNRSVDETTTNINDLIDEILKTDPNADVANLRQGLTDLETATRALQGDADVGNVALKNILDTVEGIITELNNELVRLGQAPIATTPTTTAPSPPSGTATPTDAINLQTTFGNMDRRLFSIQTDTAVMNERVDALLTKTISTDELSKQLQVHLQPSHLELVDIRMLLARLVLLAESASGGGTESLAKESADNTARAINEMARSNKSAAVAMESLAIEMGMIAEAGRSGRNVGGNVNAIADIAKVFPFQHGGIVMDPLLGLVGEAGPEAVVPLNGTNNIFDNTALIEELQELRAEVTMLREDSAQGGGPQNIRVEGDVMVEGERMGKFVMRRVNDGLRRNEVKVPERALTRR